METKRLFFFSLGTVLLGVGAVGVVLPVLPTTPLVLASFFCFTKSSKRAERWILRNRYFGSYIENYQTKQGIPLDIKIKSIVFLWATLTVSCYLFQDRNYLLIILPSVGMTVTLHIILLKTKKSVGNQCILKTDPGQI
jgi:uncharacterized protein